MSSGHSNQETEIKLAVASAAAGRRLLREHGFAVSRRRVFEANSVFDTPEQTLRHAGTLLRLREVDGEVLVTFKGPAAPGKHKSREELETAMGDAAAARAIFERLGFRLVFRYEKFRTEFRREGEAGVATLDETPIGVFFELEGKPRWIDRTAKRLGFGPDDAITASYGSLYLAACRERGVPPEHMVFPATRRARSR